MMNVKRDLERLKAKLGSAEALSWEAKRILQLYAQGLSDWQQGEYKKPWRVNYREVVKSYGDEFRCPEGPSTRTVYIMMFMIQFCGGMDSTKASRSLAEFWLLARKVWPGQVQKLIVKDEEDEDGKEFIKALDEALADVFEDGEKTETPQQRARVAGRVLPGDMKIAVKHLRLHGTRTELHGRARGGKSLRCKASS